ncbi:MAG: NAD(P)-binding domain-containing protein [Pseudomonadota bacterium]
MIIGFIGTGAIAASMVHGLTGKGHQILVSPRNAEMAAELTQLPDVEISSNEEIAAEADMVVLCLLADIARSVIPTLTFMPSTKIISVMVDYPLAELQNACMPATEIAITIPLPFIETGGCPLPVYPSDQVNLVAVLFGDDNTIIPVQSENGLNAHFAATALCSTTLAHVQAAAGWLTKHSGDAKAAEAYIASLLSAQFSKLPSGGVSEALSGLSTEGGLNSTLRSHMSSSETMLVEGLEAFEHRLGLSSSQAF